MFSNGAGRSYAGGVVHIVSQEPQSQTRDILKNPQIFKHEKCEQICFTQKSAKPQLLKRSRWSHSPRSRETSKTDNFATAPLRLWTNPQKMYIFATCARAVAVFQSKLTS